MRAALVCAALLVPGCASGLRGLDDPGIAAGELLAGTALGVAGDAGELVAAEEVLALSPEMREFVDTNVDRGGSDNLKLRQLVAAIMSRDAFGLKYDDTTRTATGTFRERRGNCLSFSTMFVAMARYAGLDVQFQEVEIPPDWTFENDTFVLNRHVNVHVDLGPVGVLVVDFNIADFRASYDMRRIADALALAHYHNNVGVARMQEGDAAAALACFRQAIAESDGRFSPAWTNLGTLYMRGGFPAHAEAAYLEALRADRWDAVAMSNLARLYQRRGDAGRAARFERKVISHRRRNPYYRYHLAREAFSAGKYDDAIGQLKYAIRKRRKEDRFYHLMGLCYLRRGDEGAAQRWLARAQQVAATEAAKRRYANKINSLLQRQD